MIKFSNNTLSYSGYDLDLFWEPDILKSVFIGFDMETCLICDTILVAAKA